jgi:hypothetical protein
MLRVFLIAALLAGSCTSQLNSRTSGRPSEDEQKIPGYLSETEVEMTEEETTASIGESTFGFPQESKVSGAVDARVRLVKVGPKYFEGRDEDVVVLVDSRASEDIIMVSFYDGARNNLIASDAMLEP